MLKEILRFTQGKNSVSEFTDNIRQGMPLAVFGVADPFKSFLVSAIDAPVLLVVKDDITANFFANAITEISGKKTVVVPQKDEILLMNKAFSKDGVYARIVASSKIPTSDVVIATPVALMQTFLKEIKKLRFEKGKEYDLQAVIRNLVAIGYTRTETAESKGTFSVRGDILDIYPINSNNAYRADFFGDTVESIRIYDSDSRENLGFTDFIEVLQAADSVFTEDELKTLADETESEFKNADKEQRVRLRALCDDIGVAVENRDYDALSVFSAFCVDTVNITALLNPETVVVFDESKRVCETADLNFKEFTERYLSLVKAGACFSFMKKNMLSTDELSALLGGYRRCALQTMSTAIPFFNPLKILNPASSTVANYRLDFKEVYSDIDNWLKSGYSVLVCAGDGKRADDFCFELSARGIASSVDTDKPLSGVAVSASKLSAGFVFHEEKIVAIGSGNLYSKPVSSRKIKIKKQTYFTAPETGDYCVHELHGIGRVLGSKKITTTEGTKDYVAVEYFGGDMLYVPVEQMDILTRYLGGEKKPKLSKIGGKDFERIKRNVKESIKKMSFDLKKLYEERNSQVGFKFKTDDEMQKIFDGSFAFEETPDQLTAIEEITSDMTSGRVMDRLVCGDVGFGKTEVAFRAVFLAVLNGKQVAMLAPTTILCEQHYNTAVERFKDFGIKIACLDRFKTASEQRKILSDLKDGKIDFIIGTHRILSKDVQFRDLGLLVLDEEQRFGVEHKEKIKLLKKNVDTLTLTATPIPRTLHMSLSGIRAISVINTPPKKRLPVQTYVTEETDMLIKDAITREINRGGQAFVLYNRVESIFAFAASVQRLMPDLKITVVHGQMEERQMEKNVMSFYRGETDVLISTTIIENGIDLPKANTLIVIDADKLGLSTLYQLKGRVGRSDRLAYAYFTFKREKILSDTAYHRLNAIVEFAEMGSGIKIAMCDLEIRGAGNVLGTEQHGHMDKIGYELYSKLLREELSGKDDEIAELDIRVSAFIPDDYIESNSAKMGVYKEIAEINGSEAEREIRAVLKDNYGEIPAEVENLINIAVVKYLAAEFGVTEINILKSGCSLVFGSFNSFADNRLMEAVENSAGTAVISVSDKPRINFKRVGDNAAMLFETRKFLEKAVSRKKAGVTV